jgi:PAS domain S-box-containing protein
VQNHSGGGRHSGREALVFAPYMVEDLAEMVLLVDPGHRIFYANPIASDESGYTPDELVGLPLDGLFDADGELAAEVRRCLRGEASARVEASVRRKDGSRFPARVTASPLRVNGGIEGVILLVIDETGRIRAEQAVRLSQATLRSIDLAAPIGIGFVRHRIIMEINDRLCLMTGYSREELIGRRTRMLYPSDDEYDRVGRQLYSQIARMGSGVLECQWVRKDGTRIDILLSSSARDNADFREGITITAMDITESKRAERAVRRSEATLRSIFLAAPVGIGVVVNRVIQVVNDRMCRMVGYERDELVGHSARKIYPSQDEFDRVGSVKYAQLAASGSGHVETCWQRKDGHVIDVLLSSTLLDPPHLDGGVTFTALDITEHKLAERALRESQERFRNIVMCSPLGMFLYDLADDGRLVLTETNPAADRIFDTDCRQWIGRSAEEVLPDLIGDETVAILQRTVDEGVAWGPAEQPFQRGSEKVTLDIHVLRTSPRCIVMVVRDITEQKHLEEQLRQAQKMEAVGRLAGGVAHDFNNQLTVIKGYCDLLLYDAAIEGAAREALSEMRQAAARAADLTGQLLAFSRKQVLRPAVLDLNEVLAAMEGPLRRIIGEDVELRFVRASGLGNVLADRGLVEQALMNLVVNARDALPRGGRITIETANLAGGPTVAAPEGLPAGECVVLTVADNGIGMDEPTRQRIFEPFFTTKSVGKGTGLGLSMVYGFVRQSGGAVTVESEPGHGTVLRIILPRVRQSAERLPPAAGPDDARGGSETILVVEDDANVRQLVAQVLRRAGYNVLEAACSDEALPLGDHYGHDIHVLITDVVMPGLQGPELAARLRAVRPDIKVLLITGYAEHAALAQDHLPPGSVLLTKPFEPAAVLRTVRWLLGPTSRR